MDSVCVYLGANKGTSKQYEIVVAILAKRIAELKLTLIYAGVVGVFFRTVTNRGLFQKLILIQFCYLMN